MTPYSDDDLVSLRDYLETCTDIPLSDVVEILSAVTFDTQAFFEGTPTLMSPRDFREALSRWRSRPL